MSVVVDADELVSPSVLPTQTKTLIVKDDLTEVDDKGNPTLAVAGDFATKRVLSVTTRIPPRKKAGE